jgi:3-isopropylmalate/(R)-2-methylmalate dehydratase small subunit
MDKLVRFTGPAAPLDRSDVDTDQIIPKQFLKSVAEAGYAEHLFYHWRYDEAGRPRPDFVLNQPRYRGAGVLLARENFGCGSSREHAVWALRDYGFRVVAAQSFADIFRHNCLSVGLLPVEQPAELMDQWLARAQEQEGYAVTVDLPAQTLTGSDGFAASFEIDPVHKRRLVEGLDEVGLTLAHEGEIAAYEAAHPQPWRAGAPREAGS